MKRTKRLFASLAALIMVLSVFTIVPGTAFAAKKLVKPTKIKASAITVNASKTAKPKLSFTPSKNVNKSVTLSSSSPKIAKVDNKKGTVKGLKKGTSVITVTSKVNKKVKVKYKITVKPSPTKVNITSSKSLVLGIGQSSTIKGTVSPKTSKKSSSADQSLTFSSSNTKAATVSKTSGKVKGVASGKSTISVKAYNGKKSTVSVSVVNGPAAKKTLTGFKTNPPSTLYSGSKATVKTPYLKDAAFSHTEYKNILGKWVTKKPSIVRGTRNIYKDVTYSTSLSGTKWSVSPSSAASITQSGVITAKTVKAATKVTVTVTYWNGAKASTSFTVRPVPTGVNLNKQSLTLALRSSTTSAKLTATYVPAASAGYPVKGSNGGWSTSNSNVATVDKNGNVTAVGAGKATISFETANSKKKSCAVTVEDYTVAYNTATKKFHESAVTFDETVEFGIQNFKLSDNLKELIDTMLRLMPIKDENGNNVDVVRELEDSINVPPSKSPATSVTKAKNQEGTDLMKSNLKPQHIKAGGAKKTAISGATRYNFNIIDETNPTGSNTALGAFTLNVFGPAEIGALIGETGDPALDKFLASVLSGLKISTKNVSIEAEIKSNGQFQKVNHSIYFHIDLNVPTNTIIELLNGMKGDDAAANAAISAGVIFLEGLKFFGMKSVPIFTADVTMKMDFNNFKY